MVALFKLGILLSTVFSCIRLRKKRQDVHSFIMKSIDNNTNENIYERKMGPIHDEPIMAKYIQPNNFYSPRVRNPRIFPSKPNEMVWELAAEINALEGKLEKFSEYLYKHQADSIMWWRCILAKFKNLLCLDEMPMNNEQVSDGNITVPYISKFTYVFCYYKMKSQGYNLLCSLKYFAPYV